MDKQARNSSITTSDLLRLAGENPPFIDDSPIKRSSFLGESPLPMIEYWRHSSKPWHSRNIKNLSPNGRLEASTDPAQNLAPKCMIEASVHRSKIHLDNFGNHIANHDIKKK